MEAEVELMMAKATGPLQIIKADLSGITATGPASVIRTYGEFADDYKPNIPVLKNHFCTYYTSWDQRVRDTTRVGQWKRDFDSLVANNALPQLNTLRIINDHTEGLKKGRPHLLPIAPIMISLLACLWII